MSKIFRFLIVKILYLIIYLVAIYLDSFVTQLCSQTMVFDWKFQVERSKVFHWPLPVFTSTLCVIPLQRSGLGGCSAAKLKAQEKSVQDGSAELFFLVPVAQHRVPADSVITGMPVPSFPPPQRLHPPPSSEKSCSWLTGAVAAQRSVITLFLR